MADGINIHLDSVALAARLQSIAARLDDLTPAMQAIGEALVESTKERFENSTGPDGQRWAPNAPATLLARLNQIKGAYDKKGRLSKKGAGVVMGKKPLIASGQLMDTMRYQASPLRVEIGTNRFADEWEGGAAVHQFGSKDGKIPERPFLGISAEDEKTVLDILDAFASQALDR